MGDDTLDPANREISALETLEHAWDAFEAVRWDHDKTMETLVAEYDLMQALRAWRQTR